MIDNGITFTTEGMEYVTIFYDIETYNINGSHDVPQCHDVNTEVAMIQIVTQIGADVTYMIFMLSGYKYNIDKINVCLENYIDNPIDIAFKEFDNSEHMCQEFLRYISSYSIATFVVGFNSNISRFHTMTDTRKNVVGYDLPIII